MVWIDDMALSHGVSCCRTIRIEHGACSSRCSDVLPKSTRPAAPMPPSADDHEIGLLGVDRIENLLPGVADDHQRRLRLEHSGQLATPADQVFPRLLLLFGRWLEMAQVQRFGLLQIQPVFEPLRDLPLQRRLDDREHAPQSAGGPGELADHLASVTAGRRAIAGQQHAQRRIQLCRSLPDNECGNRRVMSHGSGHAADRGLPKRPRTAGADDNQISTVFIGGHQNAVGWLLCTGEFLAPIQHRCRQPVSRLVEHGASEQLPDALRYFWSNRLSRS
jgi:hypothetical protein